MVLLHLKSYSKNKTFFFYSYISTNYDKRNDYYMNLEGGDMIITEIEKPVYLNDAIAKKIFKNKVLGKKLSARVISDVIGADYEDVYNNIKLTSEEIAFSSLTVNSTTDALYYDDTIYLILKLIIKTIKVRKDN